MKTLEQLQAADYLQHAQAIVIDGKNVSGFFPSYVLIWLEEDDRFAEGALHGLHPEVGEDRTDFRSYSGTFGRGSLQIVINRTTGQFHADIDAFNPYEDVINIMGHTFGEVVPHFFKRLFKKATHGSTQDR